MLVIRLLRTGKKNQPFFKIVVREKQNPPRGGRFVEQVGFYNPLTKEKVLKKERIQYWISKGAQPSDTVYNMLVAEKIVEGAKVPVHKKAKEKPAESQDIQAGKKEAEGEAPKEEKKEELPREEKKEASAAEEKPKEETKPEEKKEEAPGLEKEEAPKSEEAPEKPEVAPKAEEKTEKLKPEQKEEAPKEVEKPKEEVKPETEAEGKKEETK